MKTNTQQMEWEDENHNPKIITISMIQKRTVRLYDPDNEITFLRFLAYKLHSILKKILIFS